MNDSIRTDLAVEQREILESEAREIEGVVSEQYVFQRLSVQKMQILNAAGERALGKPVGTYLTVDLPKDWDTLGNGFEEYVGVISHELERLLPADDEKKAGGILVVGIGNAGITPDAVGPLAIKNTMVTRHLKERMPEVFDHAFYSVAALSPGVLGQTGIETVEIIRGTVAKVNPRAVIVVDALAARSLSRLARTVQISDAGICPGSGVGNNRAEISKKTIGVPVIAIGVPTVVNAATLTSDVVKSVSGEMKRTDGKNGEQAQEIFEQAGKFSENQMYQAIRDALAPYDMNLFVTPKEIDTLVGHIGKLIGFSINAALHKDITLDEMVRFVS